MKPEEFKQCAHEIIDFVIDYNENIRSWPVIPSVVPGYLVKLLPDKAPDKPEHWSNLLQDFKNKVMPGVTHWESPSFNAYFPLGGSYPSVLGELLSAGIGTVAFSWGSSPAIMELELIMTDWWAKMLGLPNHFLNSSSGPGGGILQSSGSEVVLVTLLTAKYQAVKTVKLQQPNLDEPDIRAKLVAYGSDQSHSCLEKAGKLGSVITKLLPSDNFGRLNANVLEAAVKKDKAAGFIPFYVMATLGSTGVCSFDKLDEIGPVCQRNYLWLHIDASYAGGAFICPEFRHLLRGVEFVDSFHINQHKWLLVNFDCSTMWLKNLELLKEAFSVERIYLKDHKEFDSKYALTIRNMEIPLGRRFRALKMWFTMRMYGVEGLQEHIRRHCRLALRFEQHVRSDDRFEIVFPASMGLVCFRIKGPEELTRELARRVNEQKEIFVIGATHRNTFFIRYVVNSRQVQESDTDHGWSVFRSVVDRMILDPVEMLRSKIHELDPKFSKDKIPKREIIKQYLARIE